MTGTNQTLQITVVSDDMIGMFTGRRRTSDVEYHEGPSIEIYRDSIDTFCSAYGITTSVKKNELFRLHLHPSVGDARVTLRMFDQLAYLSGTDKTDYNELVAHFIRTYQQANKVHLRIAAKELLTLQIIPINDATARNHAAIAEAVCNFLILYFKRPNYNKDADTRSTKEVLHDVLFYLLMAPRLSQSVYDKTFGAASEATTTEMLAEAILDEVETMPGRSDAYDPLQISCQKYSINEILKKKLISDKKLGHADIYGIEHIVQSEVYEGRCKQKGERGAYRYQRRGVSRRGGHHF